MQPIVKKPLPAGAAISRRCQPAKAGIRLQSDPTIFWPRGYPRPASTARSRRPTPTPMWCGLPPGHQQSRQGFHRHDSPSGRSDDLICRNRLGGMSSRLHGRACPNVAGAQRGASGYRHRGARWRQRSTRAAGTEKTGLESPAASASHTTAQNHGCRRSATELDRAGECAGFVAAGFAECVAP